MKSKVVSVENGGLELVSNAKTVKQPGLSVVARVGNALGSALRNPYLCAFALLVVFSLVTGNAHAQTGPGALITADDETGDLTLNVLPYALKMMGYIVTVIGAAMVLWYIRPILGWIKGAITGRR